MATGAASRTVRVFVSSTFEDLKAERNALQRYVFPRLAELCAARDAHFQAIDLRWGISSEASLDQRAMEICLTEIERCQRMRLKPNFIVLLGDRYGWRPLPARIEAAEFETVAAAAGGSEARLLATWYRRDDNAVPAEYVLQPRRIDVRADATENERQDARQAEREAWATTEAELRMTLAAAVESLGWASDDPRRTKYAASATEQEILHGALQPPDAANHVFGYFRSIPNLPVDPSAKAFADLLETTERGVEASAEARTRLRLLKAELANRLRGRSFEYEARWTGSEITTDHIGSLPDDLEACERLLTAERAGTLCDDVWRSIAGMVLAQLDDLDREEALEAEIAAHDEFGRSRCVDFVGRDDVLREIRDHLATSDRRLLALIGEGGSGKSAVMAKAVEEPRATGSAIVRFIGTTPGSSDGRALLASVCRQIARRFGESEAAIPSEYNDLAVEFGKLLGKATAEKPLVVFLDALDQLAPNDPARKLSWLPAQPPEHVRLVVSVLTGSDCERTLRAKRPEPCLIALDRLTRPEGETALRRWLAKAGRTLTQGQLDGLLDRFEPEGRPLYLKLAFEEARLWPSYDEAAAGRLQVGIGGLIRDNLFARLAAPENHGPVMVSHALGYIAASRYGLAEDELVGVLSADDDVKCDFEGRSVHELVTDRLPVVVWSRLYFDLAPYLSERASEGTTLLAFYHRVLAEAATERYLDGGSGDTGKARHSGLATYFMEQANPGAELDAGKLPWSRPSVRALSEVPFHLAGAERLDDLFATLTNFRFLENKAARVGIVEHTDGTKTYTGVYALQDDYAIALPKFGGTPAGARKPLIITGVDFHDGAGLIINCPWCNQRSPFEQQWRGREIACPKCDGPLKINRFVVGESMFDVR